MSPSAPSTDPALEELHHLDAKSEEAIKKLFQGRFADFDWKSYDQFCLNTLTQIVRCRTENFDDGEKGEWYFQEYTDLVSICCQGTVLLHIIVSVTLNAKKHWVILILKHRKNPSRKFHIKQSQGITGNETECANLLLDLLGPALKSKFDITFIHKDNNVARKNLLVRWQSRSAFDAGEKFGKNSDEYKEAALASKRKSIILNSHLDVVPASDRVYEGSGDGSGDGGNTNDIDPSTAATDIDGKKYHLKNHSWSMGDPFAGEIVGDCLLGRGTLDMKNMAAMAVTILKILAENDLRFEKHDVLFVGCADEENGSTWGSKYLNLEKPEEVVGDVVFSEVGGFNIELNGVELFPVTLGEKTMVRDCEAVQC
jgi:hypothetical protein